MSGLVRITPERGSARLRRVGREVLPGMPYLLASIALIALMWWMPMAWASLEVAAIIVVGALVLQVVLSRGLLGSMMGYLPASQAEDLAIRGGKLWHFTAAQALIVQAEADGKVTLDPTRCKIHSRMKHHRNPFRRWQPAVFVFHVHPTQGHVRSHITRAKRATLLELDGRSLPSSAPIYVRADGSAVALTQGYTGPAKVVRVDR